MAGIVDGDGNFDIRKNTLNKPTLKAIRIKLHNRDVRILTRIQNNLHIGRTMTDKNKPYSMYIVSNKQDMYNLINKLNGLIRIKVDSLKKLVNYIILIILNLILIYNHMILIFHD